MVDAKLKRNLRPIASLSPSTRVLIAYESFPSFSQRGFSLKSNQRTLFANCAPTTLRPILMRQSRRCSCRFISFFFLAPMPFSLFFCVPT